MSLNGLDETPITEAYQAVLAEAGGWFLLKYTARDAVDLLSRGTGGVPELRSTLEKYEEKSPLYGFLQYRRRKVILKYIPEGTSRLLQARLTVQFQSIVEKFTPNDAIFSFTSGSELTEGALSSVCMLHASANSLTSSSSSLRRKRLVEITEAAEEGADPVSDKRSEARSTHLEVDETQRHGRGEPSPLAKTTTMDEIPTVDQVRSDSQATLPDTPKFVLEGPSYIEKSLPPTPEAAPEEVHRLPDPDPPRHSFAEVRPSYDRRRSTQSTRPSTYELDASSLYSGYGGYKQKVKLGPRPSTERPHTSGSQIRGYQPRPVSSLPAGVRPGRTQSSTTVITTSRPVSRRSERSQIASQARFQKTEEERPPLPVPAPVDIQLASLYRPNLVEPSTPASTVARSVASTTKATVTPEKQRLMKALQLRKRQMAEKAKQEEQRARESERQKVEEEAKAAELPSEESLDRLLDLAKVESHPDIVQLDTQHDHRLESNGVASPVSIPDASEGPSTQGSTFTIEAETSTLDTLDHSYGPDLGNASTTKLDSSTDLGGKRSEDDLGKAEIASTETVTSPKLAIVEDPLPKDVSLPQASSEENFELQRNVEPAATHYGTEQGHETDAAVSPQPFYLNTETAEALPAIQEPPRSNSIEQLTEAGSDIFQTQKKRRAGLDHLKIVASPDMSDISDDESFIGDLDNATIHEAKPISVSRSPITPVFAKNLQQSPAPEALQSFRTASNSTGHVPQRAPSIGGNSISSVQSRWPPKQEGASSLAVKKVNVSSGISSRIKALEMFSSRESSSSPPPTAQSKPAVSTPKSPLSTFRKRTSFMNKGMAPNMTTSTPPPTFAYPSPSPTPEPTRSPKKQPSTVSTPSLSPQKKRESVSVTARIVRYPSDLQEQGLSHADSASSFNLHRSPLIIERQKADPKSPVEVSTESPKLESPELTRREKRFSFSSSNSFSKMSTSDLLPGRPSLSGRQRTGESTLPRSTSETSSIADPSEGGRESRKSRLRKRMSALTSSSRKNKSAMSPISRHEDARSPPTIHEAVEQDKESIISNIVVPHEVDIGDVNVQFPDTLLWKRRFMRIDDQGYIILTPPTMENNHRNISKRYHLSEFRRPIIPDLDRQELPHSIILDLEDGSTLQCACESKYTQQQVLRMLVDAHSAYFQLYPH